VPLADENVTTLVIPGLWEHLWSNKISEFEHDPRLCRSMTGFSEEEYEATRERWVAAACQQLKERGVGTPRECYEAREPFTFPRWILGGNMFGDGHIREHRWWPTGGCRSTPPTR